MINAGNPLIDLIHQCERRNRRRVAIDLRGGFSTEFFFFVLNSKFCTFNEGVQFQQFLRRCRVEFLAIFESDGQAEIIILEGVEMNHHDIKHSSTGSR